LPREALAAPRAHLTRASAQDCSMTALAGLCLACLLAATQAARTHEELERVARDCAEGGARTKALLVGFQYMSGTLMGVCDDMKNMRKWAVQTAGFQQVRYVTDQCAKGKQGMKAKEQLNSGKPAKADLQAAFKWLLQDACPGDTLLFHYSGHGTYLDNKSPSQCNNRDEALVLPKVGRDHPLMVGDEIFSGLVERVPAGVHLFAIVDACHSGTIFDLPWNWNHWNYLRSNRAKPSFQLGQFDWEWAQSPEELGRSYPLQGSVSLITGSQAWQTSGDMGMAGGGVLTNALITKHEHKSGGKWITSPGVLTTALKEGWSWTKTVMEVVRHVTNDKPKAVSNTQVPNFGASHRFNMDASFTLDRLEGLEIGTPPGKCANK